MHGHSHIKDVILGLIVLVVTIWPGLLGATASKWVVVAAAVLFILHGTCCKNCMMPMGKTMPKKKR